MIFGHWLINAPIPNIGGNISLNLGIIAINGQGVTSFFQNLLARLRNLPMGRLKDFDKINAQILKNILGGPDEDKPLLAILHQAFSPKMSKPMRSNLNPVKLRLKQLAPLFELFNRNLFGKNFEVKGGCEAGTPKLRKMLLDLHQKLMAWLDWAVIIKNLGQKFVVS
jgi:hypothetical protein